MAKTTARSARKLLSQWARSVVREDIEQAGRYVMAKTAKRQAARDKVKVKARAKAAEQITARKSSRKKKRGR